jgi:biofilm PGA synthesis N-glycosyltransferase PgaC
MMLKFLFFFSFIILLYSYIGYGIVLYLLVKIKRLLSKKTSSVLDPHFEPEITLIVAAYNEADIIEQKIRNSLNIDYPAEKLKLIFVTDGSEDSTPSIIGKYNQILLLHQEERKGKLSAMNRAVKRVNTPFIIFSDANTLLNTESVREIVKHYAEPRVGGVAGEKKIISREKDKAVASGEGIYWKYESFLKRLDSEFYSVIGAAGELFSIRTSLFHEVPTDTIIEDFVQSLQLCKDGWLVRYEPNAYATESASSSMREEQKRKVRIAAGAFQAMIILKDLFNVFRYPILSFQFISHRILRWTLCPLCLVTGLITNLLLVYNKQGRLFIVVLLVQCVFYAMALIGWIFAKKNIKTKIFYIPYYFLFMNLSVFMGFYRHLRKKQTAVWEKAGRHIHT